MRLINIVATAVALFGPVVGIHAQKVVPVQQDVIDLSRAVFEGDIDTVVRFTHPAVIQLAGGEDQLRQTLKAAMAQFASAGMKLESLSFPSAPTFLEGGGHRFVVVPTLSVTVVQGQRVESLNYQMGSFDETASRWTYIEGSRVNSDNVQLLFPGFPQDFEFPSIYRKRL
jgi:hypothetical protein